jgi:hypothetical protein
MSRIIITVWLGRDVWFYQVTSSLSNYPISGLDKSPGLEA